MQSRDVFAESILTNDLLYRIIFDALTPAELLRVSRTCKTARDAINWYIPYAFNVNPFISKYFTNPLSFRSLQRRTATLISGSTALQFFNEVTYPESDLDLYVPLENKEAVCRFVLQDGYEFNPNHCQDADFEKAINGEATGAPYEGGLKGIAHVFTFIKATESVDDPNNASPPTSVVDEAAEEDDSDSADSDIDVEPKQKYKQVQVIAAKRAPMAVILAFHSSKPATCPPGPP